MSTPHIYSRNRCWYYCWSCNSWVLMAFWGQKRYQYQICRQQMLPMSGWFFVQQWQGISSFKFDISLGIDDTTTRNQQDQQIKAPIRDAFESMISRFQVVYTPNEHITILEELVVLREICPFYLFIK